MKPDEPAKCPTCGGSESPKVYTQILGWECRACRIYRQTYHRSPSNRLTEDQP